MERLPRNYTMRCDEYEYTMSEGYMSCKKNDEEAVFDVFFRKVPNGGGYAVMAGLDKIIEYIKNIKFTDEDLDYFRTYGYSEEFIEYLRNDEMYMDIPVLVMSSIAKETAMAKLKKSKIEGYLQKDAFNQVEFVDKVKEILTKYHI